jgi:hypothetical protein
MGQRTWAKQLIHEQQRLRAEQQHLEQAHAFHGGAGGLASEPPTTLEAVRAVGVELWTRHRDLHLASEELAWKGQWHPGMHEHRACGDRYDELPEPGTRVFSYGGQKATGPGNLGIAAGVQIPVIEKLFGQAGWLPLNVLVRFDDGREAALSPLIVRPLVQVSTAWHVLDAAGRIIAGGPAMAEGRVRQIAQERGGRAHRGLPGLPAGAPAPAPCGSASAEARRGTPAATASKEGGA